MSEANVRKRETGSTWIMAQLSDRQHRIEASGQHVKKTSYVENLLIVIGWDRMITFRAMLDAKRKTG